MAVLDSLAQFYAWSWIVTVGALVLALVIFFVRDARKPQPRLSQALDVRFRNSLLQRMLMSLGIDPQAYLRRTGQPALAEQLGDCDGCTRRAACQQELAYGQPRLAECANVQPITRYLATPK